jgi:hypothetical protein
VTELRTDRRKEVNVGDVGCGSIALIVPSLPQHPNTRYVSTLQNGLDSTFHAKCTHFAQTLTSGTGLGIDGTSDLM